MIFPDFQILEKYDAKYRKHDVTIEQLGVLIQILSPDH